MPAFRPSSHRPLGIKKVDMGEYKRGKSSKRREKRKGRLRNDKRMLTKCLCTEKNKDSVKTDVIVSHQKSITSAGFLFVAGSNSIGRIATNNCLRKSISSPKTSSPYSVQEWRNLIRQHAIKLNDSLIPPSFIHFVISTKSFISRDIPQALSDVVGNF